MGIVLQPSNNNDSDEADENNDDGDNKGTTLDKLKLRGVRVSKAEILFCSCWNSTVLKLLRQFMLN